MAKQKNPFQGFSDETNQGFIGFFKKVFALGKAAKERAFNRLVHWTQKRVTHLLK